jgi:hypothetical protein
MENSLGLGLEIMSLHPPGINIGRDFHCALAIGAIRLDGQSGSENGSKAEDNPRSERDRKRAQTTFLSHSVSG